MTIDPPTILKRFQIGHEVLFGRNTLSAIARETASIVESHGYDPSTMHHRDPPRPMHSRNSHAISAALGSSTSRAHST